MKIRNQLAAVRKSRGVSAAALARRVGVGRQTIYAIEAGAYIPNTALALRLASALEVSVEDLFSLPTEPSPPAEAMAVDVLAASPPAKGQPVRLGRIGPRWVGVPVGASPYYLPEADGVVSSPRAPGKVDLLVFSKDEAYQKRLVLAGCDPATELLARLVEKTSGVEVVTAAASSVLALDWLRQGKVHVAGSHLEDPASGEFNLPFLRREFPGEDLTVFTFARWEEGLVIAPGNPKRIRKPEHLGRKDVLFINREPGSGSRALLRRLLHEAGLPASRVRGYDKVAAGHLAAAYAVLAGEADCCLATRSAAQIFGLDFVPLRSERYDLVMRRQMMELPAVQALLNVLQRATLRRKLEMLAGYDTTETGAAKA